VARLGSVIETGGFAGDDGQYGLRKQGRLRIPFAFSGLAVGGMSGVAGSPLRGPSKFEEIR
jgi:hypothetical protein